MLIYLSGAIEYAPDHGKGWRAELTPWLRALGHEVYDPAEDEQKNLTDQERREFRGWKDTAPDRFRAVLRKIIAWDLDWIDRSDCIIVLWDQYTQRGAGTSAELTVGHRRGIPVYLVAGMPVGQVSGWILGCASEVFSDFDELRAFLLRGSGSAQPDDVAPASAKAITASD